MKKHSSKFDQSRPVRLVLAGLLALALLLAELLYGLDMALLDPKGLIAHEQFKLIVISAALLLVIGILAVFLFYYYAWKYRESNKKAGYDPQARYGRSFVLAAWGIPALFAVALALVMWPATHRLEPNDPIASDAKPLNVQVVALRWKWLFIYPEQQVASVNFVQLPTNTPVHFDLTADETPMSSFWIPHLGGMLYAMTGHVNRLNLMAGTPGDYTGSTAEVNGAGFAGMKFTARAASQAEFDQWIDSAQSNHTLLDTAEYKRLLQPSENNPRAIYALADPGLYATVLQKYQDSHQHAGPEQAGSGHRDSDGQPVHQQHHNQPGYQQ